MTADDVPSMAGGLILIVEDSPTQALKLQNVLERHAFTVIAAAHGREALAVLREQAPALVITDINMPEMDGYELCRRIKDDARLQHTAVILLTSLADPQDILKGLECGADNFIVKPYDEEFLLARIQHVLANLALRQRANGSGVTEIFFAGRTYKLTSDRLHSIDLLLSTYETAVQKNLELTKAKAQLEIQAAELREKNTQMQDELAMARELQTAFLPRHYPVFPATASPEQSAIQFCHRYSTTTQLGGDFFEVLALSDHEAGVFICDVMGHGVRAALVAAIVRGLIEELKPIATDAGRFLTELNHNLCTVLQQSLTPLFTTAFYLVIDLARGEFRFANAAHPAPCHLRRDAGQVHPLEGDARPGPALGIFDGTVYSSTRRPLAPRDMVMLFTDGLFEVEGADGSFFKKEQLLAAVAQRFTLPAPRLFDELIAEIKAFSQTGDFDDDMCLVGVDVNAVAVKNTTA